MPITFRRLIPSAVLALAGTFAAHAQAADISVDQPFVRATVPQQKSSGAFMTLRAAHQARLLSASSPVAGRVEIHEMKMEGDVMKMREVQTIALPAGQAVKLSPGGYHLMLLDLKQQLKAGDSVPITLTVDVGQGKTEQIAVTAPVQPLGTGSAAPAAGGGMSMSHSHSH